jgi:hypothetical protein
LVQEITKFVKKKKKRKHWDNHQGMPIPNLNS